MEPNTLRLLLDERILIVELHRPQALNAFTVQMADELVATFGKASDDAAVDAVVVTGSGRAFCAGMDLKTEGNVFGLNEDLNPTLDQLSEQGDEEPWLHGVRDTGGRVALAIHDCKKPVIAAINGAAIGVGATMTLAMDIRMASEDARFGFVFNKLGIVPEACSTWFLPRIVGLQQAMEWTCTGEMVGASRALGAGLVRSVHAPEALVPDAVSLARAMTAGRSQVAIALSRQMLRRNAALETPRAAHDIESLAMFYTSVGPGKEGVAAHRERRLPRFNDSAGRDMPPFYPWWATG